MIASDAVAEMREISLTRAQLLGAPAAGIDPAFQAVVANAATRARILLASPGVLRRVDAWADGSGLVLHAFAEDPDQPTAATFAGAGAATLALALLIGLRTSAPADRDEPDDRVYADVDEFLGAVVGGKIRSVDGVDGVDVRAVVVGARRVDDDSLNLVTILHAGATRWSVHSPEGPVQLRQGAFGELWTTLELVLDPVSE